MTCGVLAGQASPRIDQASSNVCALTDSFLSSCSTSGRPWGKTGAWDRRLCQENLGLGTIELEIDVKELVIRFVDRWKHPKPRIIKLGRNFCFESERTQGVPNPFFRSGWISIFGFEEFFTEISPVNLFRGVASTLSNSMLMAHRTKRSTHSLGLAN